MMKASVRVYAEHVEDGARMIAAYALNLAGPDDLRRLDAWLDDSGTRHAANSGGGTWFYRWYVLRSGNHAHVNVYPV